jgi:hypothetical protein
VPEFFKDELRKKWGCGTAEKPCPLYENGCPGHKNPGNRIKPPATVGRGLACERAGNSRSLRLSSVTTDFDRREPLLALPVSYFPVVERNAPDRKYGTMMDAVGPISVIGTTAKSAHHALHGRKVGSLRERIGAGNATLVLNGLVPEELQHKLWDERVDYLQFCLAEGVDVMIDPQFSADAAQQNYDALLNSHRVLEWHVEAVKTGFKHVALMHPGPQAPWLLNDYYEFARKTNVQLVAFSVQGQNMRSSTLSPEALKDFKLAHESYPPNCEFLMFGTGSLARMNQMAALTRGRKVTFANSDAYASAAFYRMRPYGNRAPRAWSQGDVLKHNIEVFTRYADKVLHRSAADASAAPT